jgi:phosphatidylserine/phosphatidylglycerophosphate/cardiolipin synthase-like enzyme
VGVTVTGPAADDVARSFADRWNDMPRTGMVPDAPPPISAPSRSSGAGDASVQVLETYGIAELWRPRYSWAERGEFTIWAAYLNAISKAERYIYIEDQYFFPSWKVHCRAPGLDPVVQLCRAIGRGVRVAVLLPGTREDPGIWNPTQRALQELAIAMLHDAARAAGNPDRVRIARLSAKEGKVGAYVHAKLMLVDDELLLIGSANFTQRSMTTDHELQLAIVAPGETIANMRRELLAEHLGSVEVDPLTDLGRFPTAQRPVVGRLRHAPRGHAGPVPNIFVRSIERYSGPDLGSLPPPDPCVPVIIDYPGF